MAKFHEAVPPKRHVELVEDWNRLAQERHRQIVSGDDLSFHHVIVPTALRLLENCDRDFVLDIGSGTGEFTAKLAKISKQVIAVEPSRSSAMIARTVCESRKNVRFLEASIESIVDELVDLGITCAIANMSLMTAPHLRDVVRAISKILSSGAHVVATIPHPFFWPKYRGYDEEVWFKYRDEIFIEAPFYISKCSTKLFTTHIHRPLEQYISIFSDFGFLLDTVIEPMPSVKIQELYPKPWRFPRFIGLKWRKKTENSC